MELRHLRYFVAVAEEEHMTRAAARLGIQQPPLSQQIRDLENELEVQLFDRSPKRIRLNAAGEVFLEEARRLLAQADSAVLRARKTARGESGRLAVGYTSSAAMHEQVPALLKTFGAQYPVIELAVQEDTTRNLLDAVDTQRLDAAFVRATADRYPALRSIVLCEEPMLVAVPTGHALAAEQGPLAIADLRGVPFVMYRQSDGPGVQDRMLTAFRAAGFLPRTVQTVPRLLSAATLVAAGRGVSILPRSLASVLAGGIVYRPLAGPHAFTTPLVLVFREAPGDAPLSRLADLARSRVEHLTRSRVENLARPRVGI